MTVDADETRRMIDRLAGRFGPTTIRWLLGLLWLSHLNWKVPPDFGRSPSGCGGLCGFVQAGVDHPVLPGSAWVFEHLIIPNLGLFGWLTLAVEAALAALLLSGRFLRVAAVASMAQSIAVGLAVANLPPEWYWSYLLMFGVSLAVLVNAPVTAVPGPRAVGVAVAAYGAVMMASHAGASLGGDGNRTWSLFTGRNDIPDEFGTNVFPGSAGLGLVFIAAGVLCWLLAGRGGLARRATGWAVVAAAVVLLVTYRADGLIIGLGSRASTAAVLAVAGLGLLPRRAPS